MLCATLSCIAISLGGHGSIDLARANHVAAKEVKKQAVIDWRASKKRNRVSWHVDPCDATDYGAVCAFRIRSYRRGGKLVESCVGDAFVSRRYRVELQWECGS